MRKTKIICTLGPATDNEKVLRYLIQNGMDVARFNFSHGSHEEHGKRMELLRRLREEINPSLAALLDTRGPEVRIKCFRDGKAELKKGQKFTLCCKDTEGTNEKVSITYEKLCDDVKKNTTILLDDGLIEMTVLEIKDSDIVCEVKNDGILTDRKGINIPEIHLSLPYLSKTDKEDILFGIEHDFDYIAASFVRTAEDANEIRQFVDQNGGRNIHIIAKLENRQGVDNVDEIIQVVDGVMVARGDLGVEIPVEEVPVIQKLIIKKAYRAGLPVITATQMLESMIQNPRPTRAEANDVANAIYDGTSAIMLSGETASGKYPKEALKMMTNIAKRTESDIDYRKRFSAYERKANPNVTDAISHATCTTAHDLNAKVIITVSESGTSVRMVSRYRPSCDIIGASTSLKVCRQINMCWGVKPILLQECMDVFELFDYAVISSKVTMQLKKGDIAVLTSGVPIGQSGTTNMIKVEVID